MTYIELIYKSSKDNIYLVVESNTAAYLVNYTENVFGFLCPCCIPCEGIRDAIKKAQELGLVTEKVRWCCHRDYAEYGNHAIETGSRGVLNQEDFCAGNANEMSAKAKEDLEKFTMSVKVC